MKTSKLPLLIASLLFVFPHAAQAATRDCDNNAIIYCGADTKAELLSKISSGDGRHDSDDLQGIFNGRGMTTTAISSTDTVDGIVTKDGNVLVGGKTVATGALSTGRQDMPGSTLGADTLFTRPPSVSFKQSQLDAWVYMPGGVFKWAIIKACGNPVTATAIPPVVGKGGGVTPPPPAPKPTPAPVPKPAPREIPKTGGEGYISIIGLVTLATAAWYYRRSTRQLALAFRRAK